ncbi:hypothetical protein T265_09460 [Opisthorchis viverrini]|uniref:Uncharacterized protein n=1 Tax=Opisthorchis viverrini TaxID=6198 RepID=A0A075A4U7_OPIVI|nr:hypothetical protein T265_09460 [Opisthorchis viverrini]KER22444.1 hypothetical protein T265_09460 [Opisthorchis viverrini]
MEPPDRIANRGQRSSPATSTYINTHATERAAPGRLIFQFLRYSRYPDTCIFVMHYSELNNYTFACSDVKIQMRPASVGEVIETRWSHLSEVWSSNPGPAV